MLTMGQETAHSFLVTLHIPEVLFLRSWLCHVGEYKEIILLRLKSPSLLPVMVRGNSTIFNCFTFTLTIQLNEQKKKD